ncbi:hypothetical protein [Actinacidiphila glaucinigra]|uniref:hypothetical protein n=1 Tax=Actinacidiphila glaucinigra TaxID=235986 RepID=UPI0035D978C1
MPTTSRSTLMLLLGTGAAALTVLTVGSTTAFAAGQQPSARQGAFQPSPNTAKNQAPECRFSLDGRTWIPAAKVQSSDLIVGSDRKVRIDVSANGGGSCTVSLASYGAQGPTWQTSGKQVFQDFATVSLAHGATGSLTISVPEPECFAQIDLYRGNVKHDGITAPLPEGPDHPVFNNDLITAWRGGTHTCTPTPPASNTPSTPPTTTPPSTPATSPTPSASSPTPSTTPTPSLSTSPPAATTPPPPTAGGPLAETGSSTTTLLTAGAALLLTTGGIVLTTITRRRRHQ